MDFGIHSVPGTSPADTEGGLKLRRDSKVVHRFFIAGVSNPDPHVIQGSTIICLIAQSDFWTLYKYNEPWT